MQEAAPVLEEAATIIPQDMLQESSYVLVAEPSDDKDIVGFCRIELHEGAYFLREIGVAENWRIRGVGTALLRAAEDYIKEAGKTNLYLSVVFRDCPLSRNFLVAEGKKYIPSRFPLKTLLLIP